MGDNNIDFDLPSEAMDFFENLSDGDSAAGVLDAIEADNKALDAQAAAEAPEGDDTADTLQDPEKGSEDHESEVEAGEEEQEGEESSEEEDEEVELTPEQVLEKRLRDLQSHKDQQIAQMQRSLQQQQEWAQQAYLQMQQMQQQIMQAAQQPVSAPQQITPQQLQQNLRTDPVGTFQHIATQRPELMPQLTTIVRQTEGMGDVAADSMLLEFQKYQITQLEERRQAEWQQMQDAQYEAELPQIVEQQMTGIVQQLAERYPDFNELSDDVSTLAAERGPMLEEWCYRNQVEMTPDVIRNFLHETYLDVRDAKLKQKAVAPRKPRTVSPQQHVESSTASHGDTSLSADQAAMNEILEGARSLSIDISPN